MGILLALVLLSVIGPGDCSTGCRLTVEKCGERRNNAEYVVDYKICNKTSHGIVISPDEIEVKSEGWVSNSSVNGHSTPKLAAVRILASDKSESSTVIIPHQRDVERCKEKIAVAIWSDDNSAVGPRISSEMLPISLTTGSCGILRLVFTHQHAVYGKYEMLFGARRILIRIGEETFQEEITIKPVGKSYSNTKFQEPPEERLSTERFVSAPNSLHLKAHEQGRQYYRFSDMYVRYGSRMKLTFWYLIARGTAGEFRARMAQYKSTSDYSRVLSGVGFDEMFSVVGRWTKVEMLIKIDNTATDVALDFRISTDVEIGEVWVDDISLEYIEPDYASTGP